MYDKIHYNKINKERKKEKKRKEKKRKQEKKRNPTHLCLLSCFSHVSLWAALWTIVYQAPLSVGLSRQEYWRGLLGPPPGDLPNPGIQPVSLCLLHCWVGSLPPAPPGKPSLHPDVSYSNCRKLKDK